MNLSGPRVFSTADTKHDGEGVTVQSLRPLRHLSGHGALLSRRPILALPPDDHRVGVPDGWGVTDLLRLRLTAHQHLALRWGDQKMTIAQPVTF